MRTKQWTFYINKTVRTILLSLLLTSCTVNPISSFGDFKVVDEPNKNTDDEFKQPTVGFSSNSKIVPETAGGISVAVTLSKASAAIVTVDYWISGSSTATGNSNDYILNGSSLTFAPGETSKNISVDIINDVLDEEDENLILTLNNPVSSVLSDLSLMTIKITDDDVLPTVEFSVAVQSLSETAGTASVTVNLSGASSKIVTVPLTLNASTTASGSGVDYTLGASSLTFNPGEISKTISISVVDDGLTESNEYIVLDLAAITNATAGSIISQTITLTSDDSSPTAPTGLSLGSIPKTLDQSPTLSWTAVAGAVSYQAQIFDSAGTTSITSVQSLASGSAISSLSLAVSTTYTIKVRGVDAAGNLGDWGSTTWTTFCDATWPNTVIAMELNGANLSTVFSDVSNANKSPLTAAGNAKLSTTQKFNGTASAYFDGSGDYITTPSSTDWTITGDYTIEARVYVSVGQLNPIATALSGGDGWGFYVAANGSIYFNVKNGASNVTATSSAGAVSALAWHHVAAVRSGSDIFVYVDGAQVATNTGSPVTAVTASTWLGGSSTNSFNGYIDDLKVTKGTARYTGSTYTVPNKTLLCQ